MSGGSPVTTPPTSLRAGLPPFRPTVARPRAASRSRLSYQRIAFLLLHVPLGVALASSPSLATIHGAIVIVVAGWVALRWRVARLTLPAAYIVGSDVLWRMTGAQVPWEVGKYASALVCLIALIRLGRRASVYVAPLLYIAALLPSITVLMSNAALSGSDISAMVRFNLSGPIALGVSALALSQVRLSTDDFLDVLLCLMAPLLSIAAITVFTTYTAPDLSFTDESNAATSGGYGPNQVSAVLGLGAISALLWLLHRGRNRLPRWMVLGCLMAFAMQSAMTFSRGGLYGLAVASIAGGFYFLRSAGPRARLTGVIAIVATVAIAVVLPRLDALTGGALAERFNDTGTSHRDDIALEDLRLWREHPLLGLGPGGARAERQTASSLAHTEYTRLLSEHGSFGVVAIVMLLLMAVTPFMRPGSAFERGIRATFIAWGLFSMAHAGMRVAAFGFVFALGLARALTGERVPPSRMARG